MRVSAVITAYNCEAFVAEAISSVLNQTRPVDEIVVVDDGSTDRTREVVAQFSGRGVKYIYQENQGPGAARNRGIQETSGGLLAFLDADDVWLKDKNKLQIDYLSEHPDVALVSGFAWWWNVAKDRRALSGQIPQNSASLRRDILVHNIIGNPSRVMLRRAVLKGAGVFDPNIRWGQDWDLWIRVIAHYNAIVLPEPVIVYRWHNQNLSHTREWERVYSHWNVSRQAIQEKRPIWGRPILLLRSWSHFTLRRAVCALEEENPRWQQIAYALGAFFSYPWEESWEKFSTLVHSLVGDVFYQNGKRFIRSRLQT